MTVREYLDFVARIKGVPSAERKHRVDAVMERTHVADMAERHCAQAVEGLPPARRPGAGAHPQSRSADPRRADRRPRSEADHRDARSDPRPRRRPHHRPQHAHPARGLADLPARRHHQQGTRGRGRHAGQPDRAAARRRDDVRAGRCAGRGRRGPVLGAIAGRDRAIGAADERSAPGALRSRERARHRRPPRARARRSSTAAGDCWS